jgi:hypothetical protein
MAAHHYSLRALALVLEVGPDLGGDGVDFRCEVGTSGIRQTRLLKRLIENPGRFTQVRSQRMVFALKERKLMGQQGTKARLASEGAGDLAHRVALAFRETNGGDVAPMPHPEYPDDEISAGEPVNRT